MTFNQLAIITFGWVSFLSIVNLLNELLFISVKYVMKIQNSPAGQDESDRELSNLHIKSWHWSF